MPGEHGLLMTNKWVNTSRTDGLPERIAARAWELHHSNGHPEGYDGPCWGPTLAEIDEAKRQITGGIGDLDIGWSPCDQRGRSYPQGTVSHRRLPEVIHSNR